MNAGYEDVRSVDGGIKAWGAAGLPIEFQRGYVREIRIHIPWLKLASEPIELTIDTVELVASLLPPDTASGCPEEAVSSGASASRYRRQHQRFGLAAGA